MSILSKIKKQFQRRKMRVRKQLRQNHNNDKIRVSIFRSLNYTVGQVINDIENKTLFSVSTKNIENKLQNNKTDQAYQAGILLGNKLLDQKYTEIIFDRGAYLYHGRVKSFAEGIRATGVIF
jgi:large subunit ribosomal protein L18